MNSMIRQHHLRLNDVKAYLRYFERNKPLSPDEWANKESGIYEPGQLLFCLEPVAAPAGLSSFSKRGEDQGETYRVKHFCVVISKDNDGKCVGVIVSASAYEFRVLDSLLLEQAMKAILDGRDFNYLVARPVQKLDSDASKALYKLGSEYAKGGSRRTLMAESSQLQEPAVALLGQLGAKLGAQMGKQLLDIGSICHMIFTPEGRQEDKNKALLKSCFVPMRSDELPSGGSSADEQPMYIVDPVADVALAQDQYAAPGGAIDLSHLAPEQPTAAPEAAAQPAQPPASAAQAVEPSSSFGDFGMGLLSALAPQNQGGNQPPSPPPAPAPPPPAIPFESAATSGAAPEMPTVAPPPSADPMAMAKSSASYTNLSAQQAAPPSGGNGQSHVTASEWFVMSHTSLPALRAQPVAEAETAAQAPSEPAAAAATEPQASAPAEAAPPAETIAQVAPAPATPAEPAQPKEDFSNQFLTDWQQGEAGSRAADAAEKEYEREQSKKAEREKVKEKRLREYFGDEHYQKYIKGDLSGPEVEKINAWQLDPSQYKSEPAAEGPNFDADIFANAGRSTLETNPEAIDLQPPREEITGPPPDSSWAIPPILDPNAGKSTTPSFADVLSAGGEMAATTNEKTAAEPAASAAPSDQPPAVPHLSILEGLAPQPPEPPTAQAAEPPEIGPLTVPGDAPPEPGSLFSRLTGELSREAEKPEETSSTTSRTNLSALPSEPAPTTVNWSAGDTDVITSGANWPTIPPSESLFNINADDEQSPMDEPAVQAPEASDRWARPESQPSAAAPPPAVAEAPAPAGAPESTGETVTPPGAETAAASLSTEPVPETGATEPAAEPGPALAPAAETVPAAELPTAEAPAAMPEAALMPPQTAVIPEAAVAAEAAQSPIDQVESAAGEEEAEGDRDSNKYAFPDATTQSGEDRPSRVRPRDYSSPLRAPKALGGEHASPLKPPLAGNRQNMPSHSLQSSQNPAIEPAASTPVPESIPPAALMPEPVAQPLPTQPVVEPVLEVAAEPATEVKAPLWAQDAVPLAQPLGAPVAPALPQAEPAAAPAAAAEMPAATAMPAEPEIPVAAEPALAEMPIAEMPAVMESPSAAETSALAEAPPAAEMPAVAATPAMTETPAVAAPATPPRAPTQPVSPDIASPAAPPSAADVSVPPAAESAPTPLPFRSKPEHPAGSPTSESMVMPSMPNLPPAGQTAAGSQDARLMMNEMASLMSKLDTQVAKAANKMGSRAEELRTRLSQQVDAMVKQAQDQERSAEANLLTLANELKNKLDTLSAEVQTSLLKDGKNAYMSVEELAQWGMEQLETEQTQLSQEVSRSVEAFRRDMVRMTSQVSGRLDGLIDSRTNELIGLSDSIIEQLKETHDSYMTTVNQRFSRFEQRMDEETNSITSSLERNMRSMIDEIETSLERATEKLKETKFELEQTVANTIAVSETTIAQKAKQLLIDSILPRLAEQKEIIRTKIADMSKQIASESSTSLAAESAKLTMATNTASEKLKKVAQESLEEVEMTGRSIKSGLEDHFKRTSNDLMVRTREVGDKIRETERRMAESENALKGLADASTVDSEPELNEERNHAVGKLASLKLEASKQLANSIEQNLEKLDSKGEELFSELSNRRNELTSQVRDASESNLHKIRQALQEATNAIRAAQEKHME